MTDNWKRAHAREIAIRVLSGEGDLLLACRDLAALGTTLPGVSADLWDVFIAVASETDGLPIGPERSHWSAEALERKDKEASRYRGQIKEELNQAFRELAAILTT